MSRLVDGISMPSRPKRPVIAFLTTTDRTSTPNGSDLGWNLI